MAQPGLLNLFASHRVAANLLMFIAILAGIWGVKKLNTQFFPNFEVDVITVAVVWSGASAEDIQSSITIPIEQALKGINGIDKVFATSAPGSSRIRLEVQPEADLAGVLDEVKQAVDNVRNLPSDSEKPEVLKITRFENIAKILLTGPVTLAELRPLAFELERDLLRQGIRKVEFSGLPELEIAIAVPPEQLHELGLTLNQLTEVIRQHSLDLPAGTAGRKAGSKQVRSLSQERDVEGFQQLVILADEQGRLIRLGDIADITKGADPDDEYITYKGQPSIELRLLRTEADDTLRSAKIMRQWLEKIRPTLPKGIQLVVYDESWVYLNERIQLLLKNGVGGLVLVIGMLFLFLNVRVAWWVTVGIPISFLTALAILYVIGGTINLISLFGLIMTLGIIVDDAIVVGENALMRIQQGDNPEHAAIAGANMMLAPVTASSLTTIAAFLPLLILEGNIGNILIDIPIVVICVIVASLAECFLILPGHLNHSFRRRAVKETQLRQTLDRLFNQFREGVFLKTVKLSIEYRFITILTAISLFVFSLAMLVTGHLKFTFFPSIDSTVINASVQFSAGTPAATVDEFLIELERALYEAEKKLDENVVVNVFALHRKAAFASFSGTRVKGDEFGSLKVQIVSADERTVTNAQIVKAWQQAIQRPAGIERFAIAQRRPGPPGKPIEIKLIGTDVLALKEAALQLQQAIKGYAGVSNIEDDLPYGREQLIYKLTPAGQALGLTLENVGKRLRSALDGQVVQIFHDSNEEVEVRIELPAAQRDYLTPLMQLPIVLPNGNTALLANVASFDTRQGIDTLNRVDGELAVLVSSDVDADTANANDIVAELEATVLPELKIRYGVSYAFEGRSAEQQETLANMRLGLFIALALIYIILAWVFASYSWPVAVMLVIPFGITGAIFGHFFMGLNLTILSLFGLFGLTGIVINDSIILVSVYRRLRAEGLIIEQAIVQAVCLRLRAVLLTSLTTVAGLTPILFETSLQAQFLIPMATSIVFGLAFGTLLILLVVPAMLVVVENISLTTKRHLRGLIANI
ncbi:efflux RND transporter permease subunit [Spartinivicinus poritis]|uniref:Efflux RND transporter permease subunit n=1 Tax=Spartinivicinus poritis TaxID=2994640 RepID=A0ABT5U3S6_9GAMM|nr:efflux RND transporter permease subunit [Spartinivicinus sp. A2-2]MDE1461016.1 efflux RND transporter permease subunit [Spartinivicinus sp. A2-2]